VRFAAFVRFVAFVPFVLVITTRPRRRTAETGPTRSS